MFVCIVLRGILAEYCVQFRQVFNFVNTFLYLKPPWAFVFQYFYTLSATQLGSSRSNPTRIQREVKKQG